MKQHLKEESDNNPVNDSITKGFWLSKSEFKAETVHLTWSTQAEWNLSDTLIVAIESKGLHIWRLGMPILSVPWAKKQRFHLFSIWFWTDYSKKRKKESKNTRRRIKWREESKIKCLSEIKIWEHHLPGGLIMKGTAIISNLICLSSFFSKVTSNLLR